MRRPTPPAALLSALLAALVVAGAVPAVAGTTATPAVVRGVVTDSAGRPVANVTVVPRLVPFLGGSAVRTDARGRYAFTVSDPNGFTDLSICAACDQALRVNPKVSPTPQDLLYNSVCSAVVDVDTPQTVDLTVLRRSAVRGTVTTAEGRPVANAKVVGCPWNDRPNDSDPPDRGDTTLTDARGRYTLSMPAGGAALTVSRSGYLTTRYDDVVCSDPDASPPITVTAEKAVTGIDVTLQRVGGRTAP